MSHYEALIERAIEQGLSDLEDKALLRDMTVLWALSSAIP